MEPRGARNVVAGDHVVAAEPHRPDREPATTPFDDIPDPVLVALDRLVTWPLLQRSAWETQAESSPHPATSPFSAMATACVTGPPKPGNSLIV
jgi:hypothetical protein